MPARFSEVQGDLVIALLGGWGIDYVYYPQDCFQFGDSKKDLRGHLLEYGGNHLGR